MTESRYFATDQAGDPLVAARSLRVLLLRLRGMTYGPVYERFGVHVEPVAWDRVDKVARSLRQEGFDA